MSAITRHRILDDIARLARFPLIGHAGRIAGTHEWVVVGFSLHRRHVIDEDHDELIVVGVFHAARDR